MWWASVVADVRAPYLLVTLGQAFLKQLSCYSPKGRKLFLVLNSYVQVSAACVDAAQELNAHTDCHYKHLM